MNDLYYKNIEKYDFINKTERELELNAQDYLQNPLKLIKWFLTKNSSQIIYDSLKNIKNINKISLISKITNLIYSGLPLTLKTLIVKEFIKNTVNNI